MRENLQGENLHHFFYQRRVYRQAHERMFKNHVGLVAPVPIQPHRDLHAHMFYGPPKPTRGQMSAVMEILDATPVEDRTGYWGALATAEFFRAEAEVQTPRIAERSERIANHLERQLGFIAVEAIDYAA